jgi:hypothetical protein
MCQCPRRHFTSAPVQPLNPSARLQPSPCDTITLRHHHTATPSHRHRVAVSQQTDLLAAFRSKHQQAIANHRDVDPFVEAVLLIVLGCLGYLSRGGCTDRWTSYSLSEAASDDPPALRDTVHYSSLVQPSHNETTPSHVSSICAPVPTVHCLCLSPKARRRQHRYPRGVDPMWLLGCLCVPTAPAQYCTVRTHNLPTVPPCTTGDISFRYDSYHGRYCRANNDPLGSARHGEQGLMLGLLDPSTHRKGRWWLEKVEPKLETFGWCRSAVPVGVVGVVPDGLDW